MVNPLKKLALMGALLFYIFTPTNKLPGPKMPGVSDTARIKILELSSRVLYDNFLEIERKFGVEISDKQYLFRSLEQNPSLCVSRIINECPNLTSLDNYVSISSKLRQDLSKIHPPLLQGLEQIVITELDYIGVFTQGVFCPPSPELIKLDEDLYSFCVVAHELAHRREFKIGKDFHKKWDEVVGEGKSSYNPSNIHLPVEGFMEEYGAQVYGRIKIKGFKWLEDVATFVEHIYRKDFGNFPLVDATDQRYRQKLAVLKYYDFISENQFDSVMNVLGKDYDKRIFSKAIDLGNGVYAF